MKTQLKNKAVPASLWSFILRGNNARSLCDEVIELVLCCLLGSQQLQTIVQKIESPLLNEIFEKLNQLQTYLGLFRAVLPVLLFILIRSARFLSLRCRRLYEKPCGKFWRFCESTGDRAARKLLGFLNALVASAVKFWASFL